MEGEVEMVAVKNVEEVERSDVMAKERGDGRESREC